jgi:AmmeMemoRadiSam system protein B/AmmeMemoRadiSam system protein A
MTPAPGHVSPYAGSWYPANPSELNSLLEKLWDESERRAGSFRLPGGLGFIVPHAGLIYSGIVAAAAYRHIQKLKPERVALIGFAHHGGPQGVWIPDTERFETPLGEVAVDREIVRELTSHPEFHLTTETTLCDHSVEIQLPLLQKAAPDARLVPLYVNNPPIGAAARLAELIRPGTVLVASSDFTHFGTSFHFRPFPVDSDTPYRLDELDHSVIEAAGSLQRDLFLETLRKTSATVCGYDPIGLLLETMRLAQGEDEIFQEELDYQTSGDITGDFRHSVSYAALGFFPYKSFLLSENDQRILLESAKQTLQSFQRTGKANAVKPENPTSALLRRAGVFVTLHKDGDLRGCVGRHTSPEPLADAVPALTLASALEDSRFKPVNVSETGIEVEISVMSPLKLLSGMSGFQVNQHGAYLQAGHHRGLLLPQVASERNWTAAQFMDALARKTGVSPKVYSDHATRLFAFRAQVFG